MARSYHFIYSFFDLNYNQEAFRFFNGPDTLGLCLNHPIQSKEELILALAEGFEYPHFIEPTWEFLKKMLYDLSWNSHFPLVLAHRLVPSLPKEEFLYYLEILDYAAQHSEEKLDGLRQKKFQVLFPAPLISVLNEWEYEESKKKGEESPFE